jgi:cation transport ATPase
MITGDNKKVTDKIGRGFRSDEVYGDLLSSLKISMGIFKEMI